MSESWNIGDRTKISHEMQAKIKAIMEETEDKVDRHLVFENQMKEGSLERIIDREAMRLFVMEFEEENRMIFTVDQWKETLSKEDFNLFLWIYNERQTISQIAKKRRVSVNTINRQIVMLKQSFEVFLENYKEGDD